MQRYELHPPSSEQQQVLDNITQYNIIVDSVAGSGKTTTNLHIASVYKNKSILLLRPDLMKEWNWEKNIKKETMHKMGFIL